MLDYKNIITLRYAAELSGREIARRLGNVSKTGVNDFLRAFEKCDKLSYPLPEGITNYGIYQLVYGHDSGSNTTVVIMTMKNLILRISINRCLHEKT